MNILPYDKTYIGIGIIVVMIGFVFFLYLLVKYIVSCELKNMKKKMDKKKAKHQIDVDEKQRVAALIEQQRLQNEKMQQMQQIMQEEDEMSYIDPIVKANDNVQNNMSIDNTFHDQKRDSGNENIMMRDIIDSGALNKAGF